MLVNGYVILAPLWPTLTWQFDNHTAEQQRLQTVINHAPTSTKTVTPTQVKGHRVIIPAMGLNQPILEGPIYQQYQILNKGIWRWPASSTPDRGGNTVLIGHRFTYTDPQGVFYFLNKVHVHDELAVFWSGIAYKYRVSSIRVIAPSNTAIENPTKQAQLTLFTCTPLWLPKNRLVVVATLESQL